MKSLIITSQHYNYLLKSYKEYLQVTGYAAKTVKAWPIYVQELLHYAEQKNIQHITQIQPHHINDFVQHIKQRKNNSRDGGLSSSAINSIINGVNVFGKFLNSTGNYFFELTTQRAENNIGERTIATVAEIKQLYEATFLPYAYNNIAMGQRDRAVIALYYGCGLRRGEGVQLNINDIDVQNKLLFIRKAKGNKQRYVPIANQHIQDISDYIKEGREWFLQYHYTYAVWQSKNTGKPLQKKATDDTNAFLVNHFGERFTQPEYRVRALNKRAALEKNITLHGLRHSIATHLLQSGMDIEEIAKFLGHSSLVSTQIYTHIVNETPNP